MQDPGCTFARCAFLAALVCVGCDDAASSSTGGEADATVAPKNDAAVDGAVQPSEDASLDARVDALPDASTDSAVPLKWAASTLTLDDGGITIEKVEYLSDGLRVFGQLCRPGPTGMHGPGPYPVHIMNHGGFSGLANWNGGSCANAARNGYVAAESSYRGEDGSDGEVEVCLGEVDDVLRMTEIVLAQPYADRTRVMMSGVSHGGCITLRALQRGAPVQLAVDIFGPTDWASAYASWKQGIAANAAHRASFQLLVEALDRATGGPPEQFPDAYRMRSPLNFSADLDGVTAPLLIVQGTGDALVPTAQPCSLADASLGFERYRVNIFGGVTASAPAGCSPTAPWLTGPRPTASWPKDRYLLVYDDVGHNFEGLAAAHLFADMTAFLTARFPK